jgi:SAM-dependent methyltransferase
MGRRVDYDERLHAVYSQGRSMTPAIRRLWTEVLGGYVERGAEVLDLGCGTGIYSVMLAEELDATVTGVEPSARMRDVAERENAHPRVRYLDGAAERIPLAEASVDAALLSYVVHHMDDRDAGAAELARVVRPGGLVLVRQTLRDSVPLVPWLEFFPAARPVAERQMPSRAEVGETFAARGFEQVAAEQVDQENAPSLRAFHDRVRWRAISTLELISDEEFEQGLERMRRAAEAETVPQPVREQVDLMVFRAAPGRRRPATPA